MGNDDHLGKIGRSEKGDERLTYRHRMVGLLKQKVRKIVETANHGFRPENLILQNSHYVPHNT